MADKSTPLKRDPTGGAAFPNNGSPALQGMTLLDWFAGQALAMLADPSVMGGERLVKVAYGIAELMLKEKERIEANGR